MMLDSTSEDENQGTSDNGNPNALLKKEFLIYQNKRSLDVDESPLNFVASVKFFLDSPANIASTS